MPDDQSQYRPSTSLMEAILLEDEQESLRWVKELLETGEDPNGFDSIAESLPLLEAWQSGRVEIMRLLIEAGASGEAVAKLPFELVWDFSRCDIDATLLLIKNGFTLNHLYTLNQLGERVCNGTNLLALLLENNRVEHIDALTPYGIMEFIHAFDDLGDAPLGSMARCGHIEQAKWLIQNGADVNIHSEGLIGETALDQAIESTNIEMTRFLLAAGANPNIPTGMWITATDRAVNFMPDFEFRRKESRVIPNAVKIREMILDASKRSPPPIYPDGSKPKVWPPEPKAK